jgi:flagellar assembly protein FliH
MSSSPSRAPVASADVPTVRLAKSVKSDTKETSEALEASPFPYGEAVVLPGQRNFPLGGQPISGGEPDASAPGMRGVEREAQLRELGRQQGGLECRAKYEEQLAGERNAMAQALKDFARERAIYYQRLEEETVRLALAIARKVLHREAQVDPVLLMGIVRVALERIEGASGVALLVHPERAAEWRRYLASRVEQGDLPDIVADAAMRPEQCALRTSMGTAELGLEVQLKEIEQGLMDLLAARPQERR